MDTLLCKAKRLDNSEWTVGYYYKHEPPLNCFSENKKEDAKHYIIKTGFADWNMPRPIEIIQIDITTLCQCTGKSNSKGEYAFKNQFIIPNRYPFMSNGKNNYYALVDYDEEECRFFIIAYKKADSEVQGLSTGVSSELSEFDDFEIIGNTIDNPELLKA